MSNAVFPTLTGMSMDCTRSPIWSTVTRQSTSLREYRVANATFPRYKYKLSFEVLRQGQGYAEFATLVGFYNARQGGFDSFLFQDPDDYTVTGQAVGLGDGVSTKFQLVRSLGGFAEPVYDLNGAPLIYVNGVLQTITTQYTLSTSGLVTFITPPSGGAVVTWDGSYYRRCVFSKDSLDFTKFMQNLWELKTVELTSAKL